MASTTPFKQDPHSLLLIPGPIEIADDVLYANAHPAMSHMSPDVTRVFGECLKMTREVVGTTTGQPFLIAGSGTLGWDQAAANLLEVGDRALVLSSGYFGDTLAECLTAYGAHVDRLIAPIGAAVPIADLEAKLRTANYKVVTVTHVDTSTGVLSDAAAVAATVRRLSPDSFVVLDAVCSVASEQLKFDAWDLDVVVSASQKGIGAPPGISVVVASQRALAALNTRRTPVAAYYVSWARWLPIMRAYEAGAPQYFATPPVNLLYALHAALRALSPLDARLAAHVAASARVKAAAAALGMRQVPVDPAHAANGMTALYAPDGARAADIVKNLAARGIVISGGLLGPIKEKYFRIGHMGVSVVDESRGDVDKVIAALKEAVEAARAAH